MASQTGAQPRHQARPGLVFQRPRLDRQQQRLEILFQYPLRPLPIWEYRGVPFANHIQENPSREREMKAALFKAVGEPLAIEDVPDPEPGEGEAVIRVARCGVCGTDLHSTRDRKSTRLNSSH